jgi:hypothetical protein
MFKNNLLIYIQYLLLLKDDFININFFQMNDLFKKYCNNEINKEYLLDEHTRRNKLFFDWVLIYNYQY